MQEITVHVIDYGRKFLTLQYVDPVTGKRKSKSSKSATRKEAEKQAVVWQTELRNGLYKPPSKLTWAEFRQMFERQHLSEVRESSAARVRSTLNFIEDQMCPQRISQINEQWVARFKEKAKDGRAVETVNADLRNIKTAMNWAKTQKLISEVPVIKQIKKGKSSKRMKGRPITKEEFERMLASTEKVSAIGPKRAGEWKQFLNGLWWSGLRLSEAVHLTWDEWADGIRIQIAENYVFLLISAEDEKGGKDRVYPVAPEFAEMLLSVPESHRSGHVFALPQRGGQRPAATEVSRKVGLIGEKAQVKVNEVIKAGDTELTVKYASSHDLRRAFGVRWSRRIFPAELMELMRHENIETTMKYYVGHQAELTARKLYEAVEREQAEHNTSHNTNKKTAFGGHLENGL